MAELGQTGGLQERLQTLVHFTFIELVGDKSTVFIPVCQRDIPAVFQVGGERDADDFRSPAVQ